MRIRAHAPSEAGTARRASNFWLVVYLGALVVMLLVPPLTPNPAQELQHTATLFGFSSPMGCPGPSACPASAPASSGTPIIQTIGTWTRIPMLPGSSPAPRSFAGVADDLTDGYIVLFGGCGIRACPLGDTWTYSHGVWVNLTGQLTTAPAPRYAASMTFDPSAGTVVLFGGLGPTGLLGDTWTFGHGVWTRLNPSAPPSPRAYAVLASVPQPSASEHLVLFGGQSLGGVALGDTWFYGGSGWTVANASAGSSPPARYSAVLATDPSVGSALLFGGRGSCGALCADSWSFSNGQWTNVTARAGTGPSGRISADAAFDPALNGIVVSSGQSATPLNDSWLYKSGTWSNVTPQLRYSPPLRFGSTATYDPPDGYLLTYGGIGTDHTRAAVWVLAQPLVTHLIASSSTVQVGHSVTFTGFASGGVTPYVVAIDFADGSPTSSGLTAVHAYVAYGTYHPEIAVTDASGLTAAAWSSVSVVGTPLTVTVHASPNPVALGHSVALAASVQGGVAPYTFRWLSVPFGCSAGVAPQVTCHAAVLGSYNATVQVTDAVGSTGSGTAFVSYVSSLAPPLSTVSGSTGGAINPMGWILVPTLAAATCLAGYSAAATYRSGRIRAMAMRPRPICYAPPEWSETPEEFRAALAAGGTENHPLALGPAESHAMPSDP